MSSKKEQNKIENHQLPQNCTHMALLIFFYLTKKWLILCFWEKKMPWQQCYFLVISLPNRFPNWKMQFNGMLDSNSILYYQSYASFKQELSRPHLWLKRCPNPILHLLINKKIKIKFNMKKIQDNERWNLSGNKKWKIKTWLPKSHPLKISNNQRTNSWSSLQH